MNSNRLAIATALACLVLVGCDKKTTEGNKAAGEVLEGTISDAMIATDQTRSDPPLAPRVDKADPSGGSKKKSKVADEAVRTTTPDVEPAPEATPAPKPSSSEPAG